MSTCISSHGEYGSHQLTNSDEPFTCQWCFVFDEDMATRVVKAKEARLDAVLAWSMNEYGDSTEFPPDLAHALWGVVTPPGEGKA